ncbi:MAG: adenylate/guanylate cyclase domain-containing protein [Pseudomonadota bacterium]
MLTVLFCDLVGSTQLASRLDPEEMRELIQLYQAACGQEISRFGGYTAQYLGDGILVYFGYPTATEDTAEQAVRCALGIRNAIERLSTELASTWDVTLAVRIGVHTGMVVIGDMGTGDRTERLALGEAPNVAARIQGQAAANEVLISDETRKLTRGRFLLAARGAPELKGVAQPLALFAAHQQASGVLKGALQDVEVPIHGRADELARIRDAVAAAPAQGVTAVRLEGEAGAGKSHLLRAFLADQPQPVVEVFCSEHYNTTPFWPFSAWLEHEAGLSAVAPGDWESALTRYLAQHELPETVLPGLATLLALPGAAIGDAATARQATIEAVIALLTAKPGIVVCEDVHWADASTLDVIAALRAHTDGAPVVLILTSRTADAAEADDAPALTRVALGPVDSAAAEAIVRDAVGSALNDADCAQIIERAAGLPMFLAELARQVGADAGSGQRGGRDLVPTSLRSLLLNQLERIGDAKRVAQEAAVLGMEFSHDDLSAISLFSAMNLDIELTRLETANVIVRTHSAAGDGYRFCHALMHDVALESLLKKSFTQIHRRVAVHLQERAYPDAPDRQLVSRLARHWERAVSNRKADTRDIAAAVGHLMVSAESSLSISAYQEANSSLDILAGLITRLPDGTERDEIDLKLHMMRSVIHSALEGFAAPSVEADFQVARALCAKLGKKRELAQVLLSLWMLHLGRGQYPESLNAAQESLAITEDIDDSVIRLRALTAVSNAEFWLGNLTRASALASEVIEAYTPGCDPTGLVEHGWDAGVQAYMVATWSSWLLGHGNTLELEARMKALAAELDHPINRALVANTSSMLHILRGDGDAVIAAADDLIAVANEFNLGFYKMFGDMFTAAGCLYLGRGEDGFAAADGTFQFYEQNMGGLAQTFIAAFMVQVYADRQLYERALAVAEHGLAAVERCDERVFESTLRRQQQLLQAASPPATDALSICGGRLSEPDALDPADERNVWIPA